jgi:hypothetical protein
VPKEAAGPFVRRSWGLSTSRSAVRACTPCRRPVPVAIMPDVRCRFDPRSAGTV